MTRVLCQGCVFRYLPPLCHTPTPKTDPQTARQLTPHPRPSVNSRFALTRTLYVRILWAWYRRSRHHRHPAGPKRNRLGILRGCFPKRSDYARASIPEYWIVDPAAQKILVLTLDGSLYRVLCDAGLGAEVESRVLSGFRVGVDAVIMQRA